jgi:hypothetical protein
MYGVSLLPGGARWRGEEGGGHSRSAGRSDKEDLRVAGDQTPVFQSSSRKPGIIMANPRDSSIPELRKGAT